MRPAFVVIAPAYGSLEWLLGMTEPTRLSTEDLAGALAEHATSSEWRDRLGAMARGEDGGALHVAVLRQPFLGLMLSGRRRTESRFSRNRIAPYRAIRPGDVIAYKAPSGPVLGVAAVKDTSFHELGSGRDHAGLRSRYAKDLFAEDDAFWQARRDARYATLVHVGPPERVTPFRVAKSDRRAWVTLTDSARGRAGEPRSHPRPETAANPS